MSFFAGPTPSPSPPSTPGSAFVDSSPPASPPSTPASFESYPDPSASPVHPFSASTNQDKPPPRYEKKLVTPPITPEKDGKNPFFRRDLPKRKFLTPYEDDAYLNDAPSHADARSTRWRNTIVSVEEQEHEIWEEKIEEALLAVDVSLFPIELDNRYLTYIPPSIADLGKRVVISQGFAGKRLIRSQISRAATEVVDPARTAQRVRSLGAVNSTNSRLFGPSRTGDEKGQLHIYLANNRISFLPNQLFTLNSLVVLSLRGNDLTELSPLIAQLTNLKDLNVAFNNLTFLPAEIMSLRLDALVIEPNPLLPPPIGVPGSERVISETKHILPRTVPLKELCFRILLGPASNSVPSAARKTVTEERTMLETDYGYPLSSDWEMDISLERVLSSCLYRVSATTDTRSPNSTPRTLREATGDASRTNVAPCISTCSSRRHNDLVYGSTYRRPVFVEHAEECFTWESQVAGVSVAKECRIPLKWRGCCTGCLGYLHGQTVGDGFDNLDGMDVDSEIIGPSSGLATRSAVNAQFSSEGFDFDDDD